VDAPGAIPEGLRDFAHAALRRAVADPAALERALGEYLTEPKAQVWFDVGPSSAATGPLRLDRRTRMMYDERHVFVNGESYRASGRDAALMRRLADHRALDARAVAHASAQVRSMLHDWSAAGWIHGF
jgi:50S ribosomal protein L16 3-hydroxylase